MQAAANMDKIPLKDAPDATSNREAAEQQASKIRSFWAQRGKEVKVWVEQEWSGVSSLPLFVVRSDIAATLKQPRFQPWGR